MTTIRLVLVDDHAVVTDGLRSLLSLYDDIEVVGVAQSGAAAIAVSASVQPDVVLMDLSMPDMDGAEASRRLLANDPELRIIALTGYLDEGLVRNAVDAGASGYLLKTVSGDDLVVAIRRVMKGQATISLEALTHATRPQPDPETTDRPSLTERELAVLQLMSEGDTNREIAGRLSVSPGTVRVHVSNILGKLGVENRTAAVRFALRHGILTDPVD